MKPPIYVRPLTDDERTQLEAERRTANAFRVRRAQIILASARGLSPKPIAQLVGCAIQTVRNVIHAFNAQGLACVPKQSTRPKSVRPTLDAAHCECLQHLLHQSPRTYGKPTGVWTLALAAEVCYEQGVTERLMSDETIRRALKRLATNWKRAKHWITSPDPHYARKKQWRDRLIALALGHPAWVLGFEDEVWWSRLAQPLLHAWTDAKPLRLLQNAPDRHDPEPKAVACYGLLRTDTQSMLLRFVDGRPVSAVTTQCLGWLTDRLVAEGKTALLLVWDNASWHISQAVRAWRKAHNRRVKREGGCRIVVCPLPSKSPWLNRIEPKWVHGKRAIAEPARKLQVDELKHRICAYYDCELLEPIAQ